MGVKRTFHQEARRDQLVDTALELIGEGGLAAASTSAIARRVGISRGVVNYNVGGRDELLRLVVARVYELGRAAVGPAVAAAPDPVGAVRAFVSASTTFYVESPAEMRALREVFADPELVDRAGTPEHRRELDGLARLVEQAQAAGAVAEGPVDLLTGVVRGALDWAAGALAAGEPVEAVTDQAWRLVARALGVAEAG